VSRFKYYSTARLESILDSAPYYVDDLGIDFTDYQYEIRDVLFKRYNEKFTQQIITAQLENKILKDTKGLWSCNACLKELPLSNFYKRSDCNSYKQPCKKCYQARYGKIPF